MEQITTFSRVRRENDVFIYEEIKAHRFLMTNLEGNAKITRVGGNGRFVFELDGKSYQTIFEDGVCEKLYPGWIPIEDREYFSYDNVIFDRNMKEEWSKLYSSNPSTDYWKDI